MIRDRWRSTRSSLNQEMGSTDMNGLWSRIDASRRAGQSIDLPAVDPRRAVTPVLFGAITVAALVAVITLRSSEKRTTAAFLSDDPEASAVFQWLPTSVQAQSIGASALAPIDPPDVSRLTPRMLVYRHDEGVDGIVTDGMGTDTLSITRDVQDGREVVALIRTSWRASTTTLQAID